ncbi:MAG: 4-(cytidine 5'-diphospho)-2-C-methyl-D-erythritol kinase [Pirellulales bacterium]
MLAQRSGAGVRVCAPAKLNLFFEVRSKRNDGYHEIETLMVPVSLFDSLYLGDLAPPPSGVAAPVRLTCNPAFEPHCGMPADAVPNGRDNLIVRALELLQIRAGTRHGAVVRLVKNIPTLAGLGGGSSDAAAALLAANKLWKLGWSIDQLAAVGAELGSDIPFFFAAGPAICRGRGELVEPICGLGDVHAVVVRPPQGLSTASVFAACQVPDQCRSVDRLAAALRGRKPKEIGRSLYNRLQPAAETLSPWIGRIRREFDKLDCIAHQMTGSGTGYFGICHHARHAARVAALLRARSFGRIHVVRRAS